MNPILAHLRGAVARPSQRPAPPPPEPEQRREYFRMAVGYPCLIERPGRGGVEEAEEQATRSRSRLFRLFDLSAGGFCCFDPRRNLRPGRIHFARILLPGFDRPLAVRMEVVRRTRIHGIPAAGGRFVDLEEQQRERIMRALFAEYRRSRERAQPV